MSVEGPVLLYGAGREARSTRAFLNSTAPELEVLVTVDSGPADIENARQISPEDALALVRGRKLGLIVKSPGVSLYKPFFAEAKEAGIPITSNLNLWGEAYRRGRRVIAVTGTKGKSTTATLVHLMLVHSGLDAGLAGNVGLPPLDIGGKHEIVVFELSSYQTADMDFAPDIAGITNLYPEHVDWHGSVARYYADKLHLIDWRTRFHVAMSAQAHALKLVREAIPSRVLRVPPLDPISDDAIVEMAARSKLKGAHNLDNARLAARIALVAGASLDGILAGIAAFEPLPHRLQEHVFGGVTFVDDSISTTPEATKAALNAYKGRSIALIAGGHEREQDYTELADLLAGSGVTALVTLPVTGARLAEAAQRARMPGEIHQAVTLQAALEWLYEKRGHFDTVILSPGAPSYNQFKNFEERGDRFVAVAKELFSDNG